MAQKLAILIGGFFLTASLLLLTWTAWMEKRQSLADLENLAGTNAEFLSDLGLPFSTQLASQLSEILDLGVGFYEGEDSSTGSIPGDLVPAVIKLSKVESAASRKVGPWELATAPIPGGNGYLILVRESEGTLSTLLNLAFLIPAVVLALGFAGFAFFLGRGIVSPLQDLTEWSADLNSLENSAGALPTSMMDRADEVGILARSLRDSRDRLESEMEKRAQAERLAALGRIATSLAHEIKNPAAAIRLHADLLMEKVEPGSRKSIELIQEEVCQITDLVNQWLFVSSAKPSRTSPHDLAELVSRVQQRVGPVMEHSGTRLDFPPAERPVLVNVDAARIEQVIRNLLQNAIDAMPSGGRIRVSVVEDGLEAELTVRDEGEGFSEEAMARFGEPFFTEREGGMGIGLTLAAEVAAAHGGSLRGMNDSSGIGGIVRMRLPLHSPGATEDNEE